MLRPKVVIVSGLSGAGLTTALHTLQDNGFYCIDNLPISLLWDTIGLIESGQIAAEAGYAFGMDIRSDEFAKKFPQLKQELSDRVKLDVLFIRAEHRVLAERFGTARRRHPLSSQAPSLQEQILKEDQLLKPVETSADGVIDTTYLKPQNLRRAIEHRFSKGGMPLRSLQVVLMSFGFKHETIGAVEGIHDVRFLPNPYFDPALKFKTGLDKGVQDFVMKSPDSEEMFKKIMDLYYYALPKYLDEGRHFIRIAIGCTGGKHRSVTFVEKIAEQLYANPLKGIVVSVVHRDIEK